MARGRAGVRGSGAFDLPVLTPDGLSWSDIEGAVDLTFSDVDRQEIFSCFAAYHAHLSVEEDRAPEAEVQALRNTILSSAQNLIDVLEHFRGVTGSPIIDEDEALYSALAFSTTAPDFDLTATLRQAEPACRALLRGLNDGAVDLVVTMTQPEVIALAEFFVEALKGATAAAARSSPGYVTKPLAFEYQRWGVPLGPRSDLTPKFASAVLQRNVTRPQVEHAFGIAMERRADSRR